MKRFIVFAPDCTGQDLEAWEDTGFKIIEAISRLEQGQELDVLFRRWKEDSINQHWQTVKDLLPKLFVLAGNHEVVVPDYLSEIYERQLISGEGICFTIGSRLQGKVAAPDWEAYRNRGKDRLSQPEQIKAMADSIYRFLLQDVFREMAEWCGHTFSVVGPMG